MNGFIIMNSELLHAVLYYGNEIIFEEESDEDNETNNTIPKIENFAEEIVPRFQTHQFKQHFRLLPETFDTIVEYLVYVKNLEPRRLDGRQELPLNKQLLITIWYLGNMESFRSVACRFNVSKATCWDVLKRTSRRLLQVNRLYGVIRWPTEHEALQTMRTFERRSQIPGIMGCIDGSHIRITSPQQFADSYLNRKKYHSILLQGVCNEKKMFIDVYAGEPGSIHDSNLYNKSDLAQRIQNREVIFYNDGYLVGDLAYKLSPSLMVGFKNFGNMTRREINFNKRLNLCRIEIENAFALLKGRFRRLKFVETVRLDLISSFVVTAAILHNACILNNDLPDDLVDVDEGIQEERRNNILRVNNDVVENNAQQKRLNIMYNLPMDRE